MNQTSILDAVVSASGTGLPRLPQAGNGDFEAALEAALSGESVLQLQASQEALTTIAPTAALSQAELQMLAAVACENIAAGAMPANVVQALTAAATKLGGSAEAVSQNNDDEPAMEDPAALLEALWTLLANAVSVEAPQTQGVQTAPADTGMQASEAVVHAALAQETPDIPAEPTPQGAAEAAQTTQPEQTGQAGQPTQSASGDPPVAPEFAEAMARLAETVGGVGDVPDASVQPAQTDAPAATSAAAPEQSGQVPSEVAATVPDAAADVQLAADAQPAAEVQPPVVAATETATATEAAPVVAAAAQDDTAASPKRDEPSVQTPQVSGAAAPADQTAVEEVQTASAAAPVQTRVDTEEPEHADGASQRLVHEAAAVRPSVSADLSADHAAGESTATADQQRMISRIANAVSQAEGSGRTTVRLRLYPPELGTVRVEVSSVRGAISVRIETSTPEARQAINMHLGGLRDQIRGSGVNLRDMEVSYRNATPQFSFYRERREQGSYEPGERFQAQPRQHDEAVESAQSTREMVSAGAIDLLV